MLHQDVCTVNIDVARERERETRRIEVNLSHVLDEINAKTEVQKFGHTKGLRGPTAGQRSQCPVNPLAQTSATTTSTSEGESPSQLSEGLRLPPRRHKRSDLCPATSFALVTHTKFANFLVAKLPSTQALLMIGHGSS